MSNLSYLLFCVSVGGICVAATALGWFLPRQLAGVGIAGRFYGLVMVEEIVKTFIYSWLGCAREK